MVLPEIGADHDRISLDLVGRSLGDRAPEVLHIDPLAEIHHHFHAVFDQDDGEVELGDEPADRGLVNVTVFAYVADPKLERLAFDAFLIRKEIGFALQDIIDDETKRAKFIAAYNGPAGVADYWARMQAAIARQSQ